MTPLMFFLWYSSARIRFTRTTLLRIIRSIYAEAQAIRSFDLFGGAVKRLRIAHHTVASAEHEQPGCITQRKRQCCATEQRQQRTFNFTVRSHNRNTGHKQRA